MEVLLLLLLVIGISAQVSAVLYCYPGYRLEGSKCYKFMEEAANWENARGLCEVIGGHLAIVNSSNDQQIIEDLMKNYAATLPAGKCVWNDGNDLAQNGHWVWSTTGNELTYTNWYNTQPNGGNCMGMWQVYAYQWQDETCTSLCSPLCESMPFEVTVPGVGR